MLIYQDDKTFTISDKNWPLAVDLFVKWGYDTDQEKIEVRDLYSVTSELSAWGIPWNF